MGKGTIFYVHGAGTRGGTVDTYAEQLRAGFGLPSGSPKVAFSRWGDEVGPAATLPRLHDVLPEEIPADAGLAPAAPTADLADPLAPLRALESPGGAAGFAAGSRDADLLLDLLRAGFVDLSDLAIADSSVRSAADAVRTSPEYGKAAGPQDAVFDATLRSVATMTLKNEGAGAFGVGDIAGAIGAIGGKIASTLLGADVMSLVGSIGTNLGAAAKLILSRWLADRREDLMRKTAITPADVLVYQRNGAAIRDHVQSEIAAQPGPVVAIGHSLGGILLVDLLFGEDAPATNVELLVTFGSQSAFLQSVGGLGPVEPKPRWINIWTRYDFASFLAGQIWPDLVEDIEVPIEVGFPDSHSAYYTTKGFFDAIRAEAAVDGILS